MALELFDGSDSENDDISKIKINKEYARRFEHNKKREDLQRFEELKKKGVIDSPSPSQSEDEEESESVSSEDDDHENLFSSRSDKEFFDALLKVKKQDPILKQKDVKLFVSDDSSDDGSDEKEKVKSKDKKGEKPMYLKDVMAKHLIEEGPDFGDKEEERKKTYGDEQEELKRAFLKAVEKEGLEDGEGEFFSVKDKVGDEDKVDSDDKEFEEKLDEYFGGDVELNESSKFLRSYFMNKMWIDKSGGNLNVGEEELQDISEDEMEIERQEEYEYRFQENHGDRVLGHARKVEGSVRKKTNPRKEQRKSKEERLAIAQKEREEELKHLKNLKKQEIQEKVKKIMETAGILDDDIIPLSVAEIEEEFDPKEYDRMMKAAFDDKYYNAEDADPDFCSDDDDIEKPDFEKEDELLGLPKGWDASGSNDGFLAAREKALKEKIESASDDDLLDREDQNEEKIPVEGSRKRKRKTALLEKARQAMMDEYYKLDYEDTIGDLKTRFKYAKTKPNRFGMNASEILLMDDKELNQYVALKKLAPYREEEWKLSKQKRYMLKTRTKELLRAASLDKKKRKKSRVDSGKTTSSNNVVENEKASAEDSNINTDKLSRTAKRRRQMATLKLSQSRLKAYGKIPTKSKHGGKH
ncbi:protein KRI1 homolog isoform X2 [Abrus precatorius]|uniref:Protein KRI1 homolog isoform X2 n=1 Tax=Abrus precatorius TaxID=3816 RepID=A0A8B8LMH0_ABRPR|nr:protein KRI1 homolog isoform X2 [Abrus precatorius]